MSKRVFLNLPGVAIGIFLDVSPDNAMLDEMTPWHLHRLHGSEKKIWQEGLSRLQFRVGVNKTESLVQKRDKSLISGLEK